jgi:hypothetical protein
MGGARSVLIVLAFAVAGLTGATMSAASGSSSEPVLGAVWHGGGQLAWLDPLTLRPVRTASGTWLRGGWDVVRSPSERELGARVGNE